MLIFLSLCSSDSLIVFFDFLQVQVPCIPCHSSLTIQEMHVFCFSKIFLVRDHWSLVAAEIIFHHCHQYWFGDMTFINIIRNDASPFLLVPKHYFEFPNILDTT